MEQVALLPESLIEGATSLTLKDPHIGKDAAFLTDGKKIYQVVDIDRPHASFFVGNHVISNGKCRMATEIHPIFVVLEFVKSRGKEIIPEPEFFVDTPYQPISDIIRPHIRSICAVTDMGDSVMLNYDDKKALDWLIARTEKLLPYFKAKNPETTDKFAIELCFDVVRQFIGTKTLDELRNALKAKYPGSFPPKTMEMVDTTVPEPEPKKKRGAPKKKLAKPEGNMSISAFFKPTKK